MPALKKLKRIVSDAGDGPRTGTLFGSEIGYEDIERRKLEDYTHQLVGEDTVDGQAVYIVESVPVAKHRAKRRMERVTGKSPITFCENELHNHQGTLAKTFLKDIKEIDGIWIFKCWWSTTRTSACLCWA